jgi:hypothetical protein
MEAAAVKSPQQCQMEIYHYGQLVKTIETSDHQLSRGLVVVSAGGLSYSMRNSLPWETGGATLVIEVCEDV